MLSLHDPTDLDMSDDTSEYTLREVVRIVTQVREDVATQIVGLGARFDSYVLNAVYAADQRAQVQETAAIREKLERETASLREVHERERSSDLERIATLEGKWDRINQLVLGFVVLAILGAVFGASTLR